MWYKYPCAGYSFYKIKCNFVGNDWKLINIVGIAVVGCVIDVEEGDFGLETFVKAMSCCACAVVVWNNSEGYTL